MVRLASHSAQSGTPSLSCDNIESGETVNQRCVLLTGQCSTESDEDFIGLTCVESDAAASSAPQNWPISGGRYKALVILSPGSNSISLSHYHEGEVIYSTKLDLIYVPLLQTPPLHLAIMIAKDSPLLIDCPPHKRGAISSAHLDLDAAIKKFRMTAYMWQAHMAQDMYSKGLGRRSFRLEEEWTTETVMQDFSKAPNQASASHMRSTAKIHLVRSERTVAELRTLPLGQYDESGIKIDDIYDCFNHALKAYGGPFTSSSRPVVAGLVLDSTYSVEKNVVLAHATVSYSNSEGISLGMFGSHLTYSWPRFLEEVPSCLLDTKHPGDSVANIDGDCGTMWEACSIGQGAFLHEVAHAFGAPHSSGIMTKGYERDWPKCFLSRTAYCAYTGKDGKTVIDGETVNDAFWDVTDALSFTNYPHFWLPTDNKPVGTVFNSLANVYTVIREEDGKSTDIEVTSSCNIARIRFNDVEEAEPTIESQLSTVKYSFEDLEGRFGRKDPLKLEVLSMNGKTKLVDNVWTFFARTSTLHIPGTSIALNKKSVASNGVKDDRYPNPAFWDWTVLLNESGEDGSLSRATSIDSHVGLYLAGAVIHFEAGHETPCASRWNQNGHTHGVWGHLSEYLEIPKGVDIAKVDVGSNDYELNGLRFYLSNGQAGGYLYEHPDKHKLEPANGEKIIGFFGKSNWGHGDDSIAEFGIITAPKDVELPISLYSMAELKNTDGGTGLRPDHSFDEG